MDYYYRKNLQGDIIGIINAVGTELVSYSYDAWGNILWTEDDSGRNLAELNPFRYRGYYYDTETGLYYLNSRYYDPKVGRFINADEIDYLGEDAEFSCNLYAYCANNPVIGYDPNGHGKIYVIYYDDPENGLQDQALNSPYYDINSQDVYMFPVTTNADVINAWNSMNGDIDKVYIYLHGGIDSDGGRVLWLKNESLGFSGTTSFSDLKPKTVKERIYLFSCRGGNGEEGNNVALMFHQLTGAEVRACTGKVSFSKIFGKYFARKAIKGADGGFDWGGFKSFGKKQENRFIGYPMGGADKMSQLVF